MTLDELLGIREKMQEQAARIAFLEERIKLNKERARQLLEERNEARKQASTGRVFRHVKGGRRYVLLKAGVNEATLESVVIYQAMDSGIVWVRPTVEFFDGRFEEI